MNEVKSQLSIAVPGRSERELGRSRGLELDDCRVTYSLDGSSELLSQPVLVIFSNAAWYPKLCRQLERMPRAERPFVAIWHSEPLPPPSSSGLPRPRLHLRELTKIAFRDPRATDPYTNAWRLRRLRRHGLPDVLAVSTPERQDFLAEQGIDSHWIPFGYRPGFGRDLGLARDVDVLFLGGLDVPRRKRAIRKLRREGIEVLELGGWDRGQGVWGEKRTELLNRTRILLNFARQPGQLSGMRMLIGMANKALVVSEPIWKPAPFVPGKHFVQAPLEEMPGVIRHYLANEPERELITEEAYRFVTRELRGEDSIGRLLELIREGLAARAG